MSLTGRTGRSVLATKRGMVEKGAERLVKIGLLISCVAVLLTVVLALAAESEAAYPGGNGNIVFSRKVYTGVPGDAAVEVYTMNDDGSGLSGLSIPAFGFEPVWSPDGSKIAATSWQDGNYEVYIMNADGSGQVNLTNHPAFDSSPSWSPDGSKIAFSSLRDGNLEIYIMNTDGTSPVRLTQDHSRDFPVDDSAPAWSPMGNKIAFVSARDGNREIYMMNTDGTGQVRATNHGADDNEPSWSPDGGKIAFTHAYTDETGDFIYCVYVMDPDGSDQTMLASSRDNSSPAWSPDGSKITYVGEGADIYVMNADGTNRTRVTSGTADDLYPDWQPLPDHAPPAVDNVQPSGTIYTSDATISVDYADADSGIDLASVKLTMDGEELGCTTTDTNVNCPVPQYLTIPEHMGPYDEWYGPHAIGGSVADKAGNVAPISGSFTVSDNTPPKVGEVKPSGTIEGNSAEASAYFIDDISNIDTGSVAVTLDGSPLSGCTVTTLDWGQAWEKGWTHRVSCPTQDGLTPGHHTIGGSVSDKAGNIAPIDGGFDVRILSQAPKGGLISNLLNTILGLLFGSNGLLGVLGSY